jgi:hypothetical protein
MEKRESQFIVEALNIVKERTKTNLSWCDIAKDTKQILDSRFGGEWNILTGKSMGYAMKTRKKASLVASSTAGETVVCWKSPGFELEDSNIVKIKAELALSETDPLVAADRDTKLTRINAIQVPDQGADECMTAILAHRHQIHSIENR